MRIAAAALARTATRVVQVSKPAPNQTVYLSHVKWVTGKEQLRKYFGRYGKVSSISMFFDSETGLHRGFASVTFAKADSASAAIKNRPHIIDGDVVDVEVYMPVQQPKENFKQM